jgi:Sec-independent protein secretion pathway component TatC
MEKKRKLFSLKSSLHGVSVFAAGMTFSYFVAIPWSEDAYLNGHLAMYGLLAAHCAVAASVVIRTMYR